jgi:hypothetical protein
MVAKQYPKKGKGFGVQTGGSIGDVKETKRFEEQDEPVLVARHLVEGFKPIKACGLASVLCDLGHRNRLGVIVFHDACRHSGITRIVGNLWLTTGQPS